MNKFKKGLIMALAVGVLMMGSVFGATDTATFTIKTSVQGVAQIGVFSAPKTDNANFGTENNTISTTLTNVINNSIDQSLSDVIVSGLYYVAVRTNVKNAFSILVTANPLETTDSDFMGYNLYIGAKTKTTVTGSLTGTPLVILGSANTLILSEGDAEKGMRTNNFPFQVTITSTQYVAAVVGDYTAN